MFIAINKKSVIIFCLLLCIVIVFVLVFSIMSKPASSPMYEYTIVIDKVAMDAPASSEEGVLPEIGLETEEDNSSDATNVSDPLEFGSGDNNSAWWIILLVALLAVAGVAGFVIYSKKKKSE